MAHAFPPSRIRSVAFATFSAGAPVGAAVGMALGGILTQLSKCAIQFAFSPHACLTDLGVRIYSPTWRSTFYLTSGLCLIGMVAGFYSIPPDHVSTEVDKRVDWLGAFLVTAGLVLIVFVLSDGEVAPNQWATSCGYPSLRAGLLRSLHPCILCRHHCSPSCGRRLHGPLRDLAALSRTRSSRSFEP